MQVVVTIEHVAPALAYFAIVAGCAVIGIGVGRAVDGVVDWIQSR